METEITRVIGSCLTALIVSVDANANVITRDYVEQGAFHESYSVPGGGQHSGTISVNPFLPRFGKLLKTDIALDSTKTSVVQGICDNPSGCTAGRAYAFSDNNTKFDLGKYKLPSVGESYEIVAPGDLCPNGCSGSSGIVTIKQN